MTENEKLRALLAEARAAIHQVIDIDALQGWACESCDDEPSTETLLRHLRQRIDAALAEPVVGCARCETLRELADTAAAEQGLAQRRMMEAQKQRDEAVAAFHEATRLRSGIQQARIKAENERDEARAALAAELPAAWREDIESLNECLERVGRERDEALAELDFIKSEYGGADDEALTQDALLLKLRLRESELESESASRRMYERQHEDVWAALEKAGADAYHPEDGEPVVLWGVERLAKERDEARAEVRRTYKELSESIAREAEAYERGAEAMREAAAQWVADFCASGKAVSIRALPVPEDKP